MRFSVFLAGLCLIFQVHAAPQLVFKYTQAEQDAIAEILKQTLGVWLNRHLHDNDPTIMPDGGVLEGYQLTESQRSTLTNLQANLPSHQTIQLINQFNQQTVMNEGTAPHIWAALVSVFLLCIGQKPERWGY